MPVTADWYGLALQAQIAGNSPADWANDTIRVSLHTSSYTPDLDTHEFFDDIGSEVPDGNGYTAGGQALTGKTVTYDAAANRTKLDADNAEWTGSSITARYAVVRKDTGSAATSRVLGLVDFGQDEASTNAPFKITWSNDGVLRAAGV